LPRDPSPAADVLLCAPIRGLPPGPEFGKILARCREIQDETGWDDPERILTRALAD
jgi:hypothetical protein